MAFPEFDAETLAQAIKTSIINRMNVSALTSLSRPDTFEIIRGIADGLVVAQNPSISSLKATDDALLAIVSQQQGGSQVVPTLLFSVQGVIAVGQWAVQVSDDTIAISDASSFASGPVIGVVTDLPTQGFARVQNSGSFLYTQGSAAFLPMTPDSIYYASATVPGELSLSPNPPSGGFVQEIGYAKTDLQLVLNIQEPFQV
jgi:hypothetical protein